MANENRIRVSTTTKVVTNQGERAVQLVAISAKSALAYAPEPFGEVGDCVEIYLPTIGKADFHVLAGIERIEKVVEGHALTMRYIVADADTRRDLNELLALLLAGDGGGSRRHPRVLYDVTVTFGEKQKASLDQLSLSGLSMVVDQPLTDGTPLTVAIPEYGSGPGLTVSGRVVNSRQAANGWLVGVAFDPLDPELRILLSRLLADLMCR